MFVYSASSVPTTTSLAKMPVKMPTVAGQFSSVRPIGANTGVMLLPIADSTERSVFSLPKLPSVPMVFTKLSTSTTGTIALPARSTKPCRRSQVWISSPRSVGRW